MEKMSTSIAFDEMKKVYLMDCRSVINERIDSKILGDATLYQMNEALNLFSKHSYKYCVDVCDRVLNFVWEQLNQGHWKDVSHDWRFCYTIMSALKALSQYHNCVGHTTECSPLKPQELSKKPSSDLSCNIDFKQVMKTCDMGLIMGAPVANNILSRLSSNLQIEFREHRKKCDAENNMTMNLVEKRKMKDNVDDDFINKKVNVGKDCLVTGIRCENLINTCVCPSLETFSRDYYFSNTPVIITEAMDGWPAMDTRKWNLEYIKYVAGCRTVPIEIGSKYTDDSWSQKLMTVQEFINKYIEQSTSATRKGYLAQHQLFEQIPELKRDIIIPDYCYIGECDDVDINAWFGPQGTVSPLHYDAKHNFLSQVIGEKYIRIYPDTETSKLYPHEDTLLNNTSQVDLEDPDYKKFPMFSEAKYIECILKSGEMLYIPPKYWHFVKSLSISFSVSFWWK